MNTMYTRLPMILGLSLALNACAGGSGGSVVDSIPPTAAIVFPPSVTLIESSNIAIRGTATDSAGDTTGLSVNGLAASGQRVVLSR